MVEGSWFPGSEQASVCVAVGVPLRLRVELLVPLFVGDPHFYFKLRVDMLFEHDKLQRFSFVRELYDLVGGNAA
jgi:hypothetical protein